MKVDNLSLQELSEFLNGNLPQPKAKSPTFLQLAEMPHYENVISNIYAFFLRPTEAHGFGAMFLQALLDEVGSNIACEELNLEVIAVNREVITNKGNRIDLLVNAGNISIIIENKIYHHDEYNPFNDYWDFVESENKIGIIISLYKVKSKHERFVSITHRDFMHRIMSIMPTYFSSASPKFLIYLQDLFQDIDSLYPMHNSDNLAAVKFFIDNREKFAQLEKIRQQADNFKLQEIDQVAQRMQKTSRSTGASSYRYIDLCNTKEIRLSYEIWMGSLFATRSFMIRLCSTGETAKLDKAYNDFEEEASLSGLYKPKMPRYGNWLYFFEKIYHVENDNGSDSKLLMFADVLCSAIENDWTTVTEKILISLTTDETIV